MNIGKQKTALQRIPDLPAEQRTDMLTAATELTQRRLEIRLADILSESDINVLGALNDDDSVNPERVTNVLRQLLLEEHDIDLDDLAYDAARDVDRDVTRGVETFAMDHQALGDE
jgi:hypothetical protein